jgi:hypothetical protein
VIVTIVLLEPPGEEIFSALAPNVTLKGYTVVSVRLTFAASGGMLESVILIASAALFTTTVGIPLIAPVNAFNVNPACSVPEVSDHA